MPGALIRRLCAVTAAVFAAAAPVCAGLDPSRDITQYNHRVWTKRDGLPQNSVLAMAQTRDGYLWVGTQEGLARFDGVAFVVYPASLSSGTRLRVVSALCTTRDGSLWIGTTGDGIAVLRDGVFCHVTAGTSFEHLGVRTLFEDREGSLWAATGRGLLVLRADSIAKVFSPGSAFPSESVTAIAQDSTGRLLVAARDGVYYLEGDRFERLPALYGKSLPIRSLLVDSDGALWCGMWERGVVRVSGNQLRFFGPAQGIPRAPVRTMLEDRSGSLWIGTMGGGLVRIARGLVSRFDAERGLSGDEVQSLFEDREGNLWVGTSPGGLNRFVNSKFTTFRTGITPSKNTVWSVYEDRQGSLLAGNATGELLVFRDGRFQSLALWANGPRGIPMAICQDRKGSMWIGTSQGLYRESRFRVTPYQTGVVYAILESSRGDIWVGTSAGLLRFNGGMKERLTRKDGLSGNDVRVLHEDRHGTLWVGTMDGGVTAIRFTRTGERALETLKVGDGVRPPPVFAILEDVEGMIWLGTGENGLMAVRDGRLRSITSSSGLPDDVIFGMVSDGSGNLWVSSNNGISKIDRRSLLDVLAGRRERVSAETFGMSDGMTSDECNGGFQNAAARTRDGRLWFPTTEGVVMVDPSGLPVNTVPPTVVIERAHIDRTSVVPIGEPVIPPGDGELEFAYTGLSFTAPERVRFRVKLEGFNDEWIETGSRREAYYTNIPPGTYTFRVTAQNADGVWNADGASFTFSLEPHFNQTASFYVLLGCLAIAMALGGHLIYRRDRDRALVASRLESRLAQAQLQVLKMQLQPHFLFNTLNGISVLIHEDPVRASTTIARLSEFLRLTLENSGLQEVPLRKELEFLDRYLQIELVRFGDRLSVDMDVPPELREALVPNLILQPLVENAIRHGVSKRRGAARIHIRAQRENGRLAVHVTDNGAGLNGAASGPLREGVGLGNTRARLHQLYGDDCVLELQGLPEGGVDVSFGIPFHLSPNGTAHAAREIELGEDPHRHR